MKMMHGAFFLLARTCRGRATPDAHEHLDEVGAEMVKNGTLASPAMARASSVLPVREDRPAGSPSESCRQALELLRVLEELDDLLELLLGFVDARHVLEGDAAAFSVSSLARDLPKPMALPHPTGTAA